MAKTPRYIKVDVPKRATSKDVTVREMTAIATYAIEQLGGSIVLSQSEFEKLIQEDVFLNWYEVPPTRQIIISVMRPPT